MIRSVAWALGLLLPALAAQAADLAPAGIDIGGWPRSSSAEIGCAMEKTLGHRDGRFNCALSGYTNAGDLCKDAREYYEGPTFPEALAARVHPKATAVALGFEHGSLQKVSVTLKGKFTDQEVRKAFGLPDYDRARPQNIRAIDVQSCGPDATCLLLEGFRHRPASEVNCPVGSVLAASPGFALQQIPALAQALDQSVGDIDEAAIEPGAGFCAKTSPFVESLKAQFLLQVFGNFALDRVANALKGVPSPAFPPPFSDARGRKVGLKDLLRLPEPMERLGQVLAVERLLLARHRTIALAGIDDLLRFEALEPLLSRDERDGLLQAYWMEPLADFHANPAVAAALGEVAECYSGTYVLKNVAIGDRRTFVDFSPLANYYLMFWMRRRAEGNADLARAGLEMVRASLSMDDPASR